MAVATAGIQNGLVVYNFDEHEGLCPDGLGVRPFGINQFNPPIFEGDGASDAFFSEDDKLLFVTVKGDTMNDPGFLSVYPIIGGNVAVKDVRSSPEGTHLLFGAFQIAGTRKLFVSDSQFGTVILKIGDDDEGDTVAKTVIPPGIQGSCWAEYSPVSKSAWVTNPVTNNLVELDVETNAILSQTDITINKTKGMLDFVVPGNFLYALGAATDKEPSSMLVLGMHPHSMISMNIQNANHNYFPLQISAKGRWNKFRTSFMTLALDTDHRALSTMLEQCKDIVIIIPLYSVYIKLL